MTEETLFELARQTPETERAALLDRKCEGMPELRARVEALLKADAASSPFSNPSPTIDATTGFQGTASYNSSDPVPGIVIAGRYTLEQKLGEGGMGEVWVAKQTEPVKRKVALKLIKAGMDSKSVLQRFEQERQALAMMDHPHIAKVLDGGLTHDRRPFFVMELVNGLPLTKFCDETKLGIRERLELFVPICQAVQHAHQKGIVHRDLKPSNILVTMIDGKPVPKVIDFGVAKATGGKLTDESLSTQFGAVIGTLEYMSPEQAGFSNQDVDTRADIYSLGVILYELLTGLRPFDSKRLKQAALDEVIRIIREEEPSKPSTKLSTDESLPSLAAVRHIEPNKLTALLRGELDWVVMKCLEKQRDRRYESANGLARDIQRYLSNEVVEARPPSVGYRFIKFVQRNRGKVIAAGLLFVTLVAGIGGTTWGLLEAQKQRDEAEIARQNEAIRAEGEEKAKLEAVTAANAERAAKNEAQKNLEFARKGNELLGSVFKGLNPKKNYTSVGELLQVLKDNLNKAVMELENSAIGDPIEVASLQNTLGISMLGLGDPKQAIILFEKSHATRTDILGANHADTFTSTNNLAVGYLDNGQFNKAISLLENTWKLMNAKLGSDHPITLCCINNLALCYKEVGMFDKALTLSAETLKLRKASLGLDHTLTHTSMNNLATHYMDAGQLDKALPLLEETLQLRQAKLGLEHPETLGSMNNLAMGYKASGQLDKALPLFEKTLQLRQTKLGLEHPETLGSMSNLALVYRDRGQHARALPLFEEALRLRKVKLGLEHPETLESMNNLALAYGDTGQHASALQLFEETLKLRKAKLGLVHPATLMSMNNLAMGFKASGQLDKATPLLEDTMKLCKTKLRPDHPQTLTSMNNLALCYKALNQVTKAIELQAETLKLSKAIMGDYHPKTIMSLNNLARSYQDSRNLDRALPLFEEASRGIERCSYQHSSAVRIISNTILAYEQAKHFEQAEVWRRKWMEQIKTTTGGESPSYADELEGLGLNLQQQKKWNEAVTILRETLRIREKKQFEQWITFNTQSLLGGALLGQKKYAEAEPLLLKGFEGMKAREKTIPPQGAARHSDALDRLIQLYTETNKPDEVKKWQGEKEKLPKVEEKKP